MFLLAVPLFAHAGSELCKDGQPTAQILVLKTLSNETLENAKLKVVSSVE